MPTAGAFQFVVLDMLIKLERDFIFSIETFMLAALKHGSIYKFVIER